MMGQYQNKYIYAICEKECGQARIISSNFSPKQMTEWIKDSRNWIEIKVSSQSNSTEDDKEKVTRLTKLPDGTKIVTIMFQVTRETWDSRIRGFRPKL